MPALPYNSNEKAIFNMKNAKNLVNLDEFLNLLVKINKYDVKQPQLNALYRDIYGLIDIGNI